MQNYYEILEVSQNASPEVIEKAYKTLVKKYHPDLQPNDKKQDAENKIKLINEAYDILSNVQKRETYDRQLKMQKIKQEHYNINSQNSNNHNQNIQKPIIKNPLHVKQDVNQSIDKQEEYNRIINDAYKNAYQNAYNQAYINHLKNMGYQIRYEKTLKEKIQTFFAAFLTILFLIFVCFILWHIPFVKNYFINLYNDNEFFKFLVDIICNLFSNFISIFTNK